jgi:hypothetical protein
MERLYWYSFMSSLGSYYGMQIRNEALFGLCEQALKSTLVYLNESMSKGETFAKAVRGEPIIEEDQFRGLEPYILEDKGELVTRHMPDIEKIPQVRRLSEFLEFG